MSWRLTAHVGYASPLPPPPDCRTTEIHNVRRRDPRLPCLFDGYQQFAWGASGFWHPQADRGHAAIEREQAVYPTRPTTLTPRP